MTLRRRLGSLAGAGVVGAGRAPELVLVDHNYNILQAS